MGTLLLGTFIFFLVCKFMAMRGVVMVVLKENQEINFTVEEGKNGANLLVDFVIEV